MAFDFEEFLRRMADTYDPRYEQNPNFREEEEQNRRRADYEARLAEANIANIQDAPGSRLRDDTARQQQFEERERQDREQFESRSKQVEEAAKAAEERNRLIDEDRDAKRLQEDERFNIRETRQAEEFDRRMALLEQGEERRSAPKSQELSPSEYFQAGMVEDITGNKSFNESEARRKIDAFERFRDPDSAAAQRTEGPRGGILDRVRSIVKERNRAEAEAADPSSSVNERQEALVDRNAAIAQQRGAGDGRTSDNDPDAARPPALIDKDVKNPEADGRAQDIEAGLREFEQAARSMGDLSADPEAAKRFNKMISPGTISRIEKNYGPEAVEKMRNIYRQSFGENAQAPF